MATAAKKETASMTMGMGQLETILDEYLVKKAPALPANIKDILVKIAPYLTLVGVVLSVPALLTLFTAGNYLNSYAAMAGVSLGYNYYVAIGFTVVIILLEAMAIPGLFAKTKKGWNFLFYSVLVSGVYSLVTASWMGLILGTLVSLYFMFQVRSRYK